MQKKSFSDFAEDLALHFGQDKYTTLDDQTKKRFRSWYGQVQHLPDACLFWMAGQIKNNNKYFPSNLSKTILDLWPGWKSQNPEKCAPANIQSRECNDCVDGVLYAYRWEKNQILPAAFRCSCGKAYRDFPAMPITSKADLERKGWVVTDVMPSGNHATVGGVNFKAAI